MSGGAYPVVITYNGNEDDLIKAAEADICGQWSKPARGVEIKEFTKGITILGSNGSSTNFGIWITKSSNVVVRNMRMGYMPGGAQDGDAIRIDDSPNVWIDHNGSSRKTMSARARRTAIPPLNPPWISKRVDQRHRILQLHSRRQKVGLSGSSNSDTGRNLTYHHNVYSDVNARLPLQRGGQVHAYNNLYSGVTSSGLNVRQNGIALIESNWFENAKTR